MNCIFAKTIYTGKSIVSDAYLVFSGQKISGISKTAKGQLLGKFNVLTPAFIDPHSHIGMERSGEPRSEGEANDQLDSILALTDALDSVQMDDKAFRDAVESGVLYSCVVPGSGNIVGGQSAVIRNYAKDSTAALIGRAGMSKQQAIELVSRQNARILGVDKQLGTLAKGKWASFICWSGDPFDLTNYPVAVYGEGELLYSN